MVKWMRNRAIGIYISVPFCRSKCTYCNFASGVYPASDHARYVDRLIEDLEGAGKWAGKLALDLPRRVDTVYLGGGTPSLLEPELIGRLFSALRSAFEIEPEAEITVECAPGQLPQPVLDEMVAAGVNRVSLGVQSFVDVEAHQSGRLHNRAMVTDDLKRLRASGISNLNLDLIAGLAGQTFASWDESLGVLLDCGVPHASVYMLEVDEDSRLGREMLAGGARYRAGLVPSDDAIARMYETAVSSLESAGLSQYEISNFARAGFESRHNLRYWERRPYLGLGLDASSMLREGEGSVVLRASTSDDLKAYLSGDDARETACLSLDRQMEEAWFLGLRTNAGVDIAELEEEFGAELTGPSIAVAERLVEDGMLTRDGERFRLTERGRMVSNDVFQEFLAEPEKCALD
jgi:oxygen-independent coproporphyrinogen-3 oxidase